MTSPTAPDPVDDLLASCLVDDDPARAVAAAIAAHPEHAAALRERYDFLCRSGAAKRPAPAARGQQLGPFRLGAPLGGGGMGVVFAATDERAGGTVAIKLVRPEWLWFPGARERFAREIEAVERLDHPGIVRVRAHDLGDSVPWYAMDLVAGRSLAAVLAEHRGADPGRLPPAVLRQQAPDWPAACLQVAVQVAEALAHAHAHDVVHRDVKPSNVMLGDDGRARLIDFGLAHMAAAESLTRTGVQPGSLAYMSPEQARGEEVDARTDVWSLGVLLYELLTLHQPFLRATEAATRQAILMASVPSLRGLGAGFGDRLEAVVATAMAPERERRYQDMAAFAADLHACRLGRRVGARRPGPWLRTHRWLQRHPVRAAIVLVATFVLGVLPTLLLLQEHAARSRIEHEAQRARSAVQFVQDLFYEAEPHQSRGNKAPIRVLLQRGVRRLRSELGDQPEVRAELLDVAGTVLANLGLCVDAEPLLRESLQLRAAAGTDTTAALTTRERLAQVLSDQERYADAETLRRELMASHAAAQNATGVALARVGIAADLWHQDRIDRARQEYDEALTELARLLPADDLRLLRARRDRAAFLLARVDPTAALAELEQVHARLAAKLPADDPTLLQTTELLATAEIEQDRPRAAEQRLRAAETGAAAVFDLEHPILAALRVRLALALASLGRSSEGLQYLRTALTAYRSTHGDDHPLVARTRHYESLLAFDAGDLTLAAESAKHALQVYERSAPSGSHDFAMLLGNLARVETLLGRPAMGRTLGQRALAMHERVDGAKTHHAALTLSYLAYAEAILGELATAKDHAREAVALSAHGGNARERFHVATYLADILLIDSDVGEAAVVIATAASAHAATGSDAGQATLLSLSGFLHYQQQDYDAAERDLVAALAAQDQYGADHPYRARPLGFLGAVHVAQARYPEAIARLQEAVSIRRGAATDLYAVYPLAQLARAHQLAGNDAAAWDCGREVLDILRRHELTHSRIMRPTVQLLSALLVAAPDRTVRTRRQTELLPLARHFLPEGDALRRVVERLAGER